MTLIQCIRSTILLATMCGLAGCATNFPEDVTLVSVDKLDRARIAEVVGEDSDFPLYAQATTHEMLRVRISTRADVIKYARDGASTLRTRSWICDDEELNFLLTSPFLYLRAQEARHTMDPSPDASGQFIFDVVLIAVSRFTADTFTPHDLRLEPRDVCLQIGGSNIVRTFHSNTVRITKEQLQRVLSSAAP